MKPLVKRILEAGLVDKHTVKLLEKWKHLDDGASNIVGNKDVRKVSARALVTFAEEIEDLVESSREAERETRLAIQVGEPFLIRWKSSSQEPHQSSANIVVFKDNMGNFIFPPTAEALLMRREQFVEISDGTVWSVVDYVPLYVGDVMYAYQVTGDSSGSL